MLQTQRRLKTWFGAAARWASGMYHGSGKELTQIITGYTQEVEFNTS